MKMRKCITIIPDIVLTAIQVVGLVIAGIGGLITILCQLTRDGLKKWENAKEKGQDGTGVY